ncbi:MAG: PRC-barrel domain-containing protein [Roseicyclus sp.]
MTPRNMMLTTALAAVLAAPVAAQDTGTDAQATAQQDLGGYSVGEFLDLAVLTSDGTEAGQVQAVIEGPDGAQILVSLEDKTIALPLDSFSMSEDGQALTVDRSLEEMQQMAAFEPAGEMEFGPDTQLADTMGSGDGTMTEGSETETAETEELDTTVIEDTAEDVTVITTDPSAVEEGDTEMAQDDATAAEGDTEMAEDDAMAAEGDTEMAQDDAMAAEGDTEMAEDDAMAAEGDTEMAQADTGGAAAGGGTSPFSGMTVDEILGLKVVAADGADVGEIDYIFQEGGQYMAVIGIGGFLGLGEHTVALPLSDFSMNGTGDGLMLENRTEADLEAMQEIDESAISRLEGTHVIEA